MPDIVNHFDTAALLQAMRGYQRASKQKALQREQQQNRSQSRQDHSRPRDSNNSGNRDRRVRSRQSRGGLRGGNRDSSRGGNRRGSSDRNDSSGDNRGASDGNSDPCPYRTTMDSHRNHSWADCIYNPTGRNFNQSLFDVMVQRSNRSTGGGNAGNNPPQGGGSNGNNNPRGDSSAPLRSTWGSRPSAPGRGSDQHASDSAGAGNGWNAVPANPPAVAPPPGCVPTIPVDAEGIQQWSDLRNPEKTVPGTSHLSSSFSSSPDDQTHHLDILFSQQCQIQTGPPTAMPAAQSIPMHPSTRSSTSSIKSMGAEWTFPTSTTCPPKEVSLLTPASLCRDDAFISEVIDPNNGYLDNLESYDEFYSQFPSSSDVHSLDSPSRPECVPLTIVMARHIGGVENTLPLRALLDSGADKTILHSRCLQPGMIPRSTDRSVNTTMGTRSGVSEILLEDIVLPEFSRTKHVTYPLWVDIYDAPNSRYDIIIGRDLLRRLGVLLDFDRGISSWDSIEVAMRDRDSFATEHEFVSHFIDLFADDDVLGDDYLLDSNYKQADLDELLAQQTHLTPSQQQDLLGVWLKCGRIFDGVLRAYPDKELHLDLMPDAKPAHHRHFAVPRNIHDTFKKELFRFVDISILERVGSTEWAAPHFAIPKKDGRLRMISDFRSLNAQMYRLVYPFPRIEDILRRRKGYKYFTKLDISMCFHTFKLDEFSSNLCVITTPFGKFRYRRLPMGVKQSPDFCQELMEEVLADFRDHVEVYIDDIGVFSDSWEEHVEILNKVLQRLQDKNFSITPHKCEWAMQETDFLGHWLTPTGLRPWKKKISAILALSPPRTMKELRSFIGMVNFYRHMYPQRSHHLAPLTALTGKKTFEWSPQCQKAFENVKAMLAHDAFIRYPDHNIPFHVYVDTSDYQLGAVIMQENIPVAYFSRKLNPAQRNYTTMEKELLSIVETLKEFRSMLLGCAALHIQTDHKNLTYSTLNSQRVLRWRLFLEEYNPIFHYIPGQDNVIADALSRLPLSEEEEKSVPSKVPSDGPSSGPRSLFDHSGKHSVFQVPRAPNDDPRLASRDADSHESPIFMDEELIDVYLNHPAITANQPLPVDYATIFQHQQNDAALMALVQSKPDYYHLQPFPTENPQYNLVCYRQSVNALWRIRIPDSLLLHTVNWYHLVLNHAGSTRLRDTIAMHMTHPQLGLYCDQAVSSCPTCQRLKVVHRHYGELPPREVRGNPWSDIAIDLVGPWTVKVHGIALTFQALTVIDTVTNFCEIIRIYDKTARHVGLQLENSWLSRYPRPVRCLFDQGGEFIGHAFTQVLRNHGVKPVPLTVKYPQSNALCERLHLTIGNSLRAIVNYEPPQNIDQAALMVNTALQTAAYSARTAIHGSLKHSPGSLAFHRDMLFDIPILADMELIRQKRQIIVDERARLANRSRVFHDYKIGDRVLIRATNPDKLALRTSPNPFTITRVHSNGTVTIQRGPHVTERINIRRLIPYRV